jgi:hypothetical protein
MCGAEAARPIHREGKPIPETTAKPETAATARPRMALARLAGLPCLFGAILVFATLLVTLAFHIDSDTWWHLVVGQRILATHSWPTSDIYSFTAYGTPWIAYEWLPDVTLAWAYGAAGFRAWMGLLFALASAITLLTYYYAYLRCGNPKAAFVATGVVLPLAGVSFSLHPQLFGYAFLLLTLICLELFEQGRQGALWLLPLIFVVWINTHGTFVIGYLALAAYGLGGLLEIRQGSLVANRWERPDRIRFELAALLSLAGACLTPYGTRLASYPLQMVFLQRANLADVTTWQPLDLRTWPGKLFLIFVLLLAAAFLAYRPALRLADLALFLFGVAMTALHARMLPLFAIVFTPLLAGLLGRWISKYEPSREDFIRNAILATAVVLAIIWIFPARQYLERAAHAPYPEQAMDYLRDHPQPAPLLNKLDWGGYLLYRLGPEHRVFIDGRIDIYEYSGVFADYEPIMNLDESAPRLLRKYDVRSCLISATAPLATFLENSPEWHKVYSDQKSVLFARVCKPQPSTL